MSRFSLRSLVMPGLASALLLGVLAVCAAAAVALSRQRRIRQLEYPEEEPLVG